MNRIATPAKAIVLGFGLTIASLSGAGALDGTILEAADMHVGPEAGFPVVGNAPKDAQVLINGCTQNVGWCSVRHDGRHGWVPSASVKITGITRSTNKFDDAVIVIDVTRGQRMRRPLRSSRAVPAVGNGAPVLRFDLDRFQRRYYDPRYSDFGDRYYNTSSSDRYNRSGRYYDNRFGQYYGVPVIGKNHGPRLRFDLDRLYRHYYGDRRYRSFIGPARDERRLRRHRHRKRH